MSLADIFDVLPKHQAFTWVPFHPAHVRQMQIKSQNMAAISHIIPLEKMLEAQARHGHAITAIVHGRPAACFGAVHIWQGVEEMWLLTEERVRDYPLLMTKAGKTYRDFRVIAENLHRLQITVRCEDMRAVRWATALGFEIEGFMKKYGPDKADFYMMSRS